MYPDISRKSLGNLNGGNMKYKTSKFWISIVRIVSATLTIFMLSGCFGGYQLVTFGPSAHVSGWHQYATPRPPISPLENSVIQVAKTKKNIVTADSEILFIINDTAKAKPVQVIDVVRASESKESFPERLVSRYRILDGKIAAMSDPVSEFYVDADFERAIFLAISKTWSADRVLIYNYGAKSVAILSSAVNKCTTDIKVYTDGAIGGIPIAEKRVAFCFAN